MNLKTNAINLQKIFRLKEDLLQDWYANSKELITRLNDEHKDQQLDFSRPHQESDVLTMLTAEGNIVVFPHPNASRNEPLFHLGPIGSMVFDFYFLKLFSFFSLLWHKKLQKLKMKLFLQPKDRL